MRKLAAQEPDGLAPMLRSEPDAPTVFVLRTNGNDVTFGSTNWDPGIPRSVPWSMRLPASALTSREFVTTRVGDWLVAALRTG